MPEQSGPYKVVAIGKGVENQQEVFLAAMMVLLTDWENTERRQGRRGEYATTGAQSFRLREIPRDMAAAIAQSLSTLGFELSEDDIAQCFANEFDYQVSFSINRFPLKQTAGLTATDMRAIERVRAIMSSGKRREVTERLAG